MDDPMTARTNGEYYLSQRIELRKRLIRLSMGLLLTCMGTILGKQGLHDEALAYYERAKEQLIATGGNEDIDTANAYYKVATQYLKHNDPESAE